MSTKWVIACVAVPALLAAGCSVTNQLNADLQYSQLVNGSTALLEQEGIGVLTPSAPTGQESDRQALADALGGILERDLNGARVVPLPALLSAVNQAGLSRAYSDMYAEYDRTGILERDTLGDIGDAVGTRFVAKLNLGNFEQQTSGRARILGVRFLDTRTATIRVHLEIWDTQTGAIVWQGNQELTYAQERVREKPVTFQQVAAMAAERLVARLGESGAESIRETPEAVAHAAPAIAPVACRDDETISVAAVSMTAPAIEPAAFGAGC